MKYHQFTRLFIKDNLSNTSIALFNPADIHYLTKVMRKRIKDQILLFNAKDGEYLAEIVAIKPKEISFKIVDQTRLPELDPEINLIFAPIKHARIGFLLEKATELGVTKLIPIKTKHSVIDKINLDKWHIYVKDAAEQCRRLSLPEILPLSTLDKFLIDWSEDNKILLCNETEKSLAFTKIKKTLPINIMIGPEGGFSTEELKNLTSKNFISSVHLGARILRAETAAIVAITLASINNYLSGVVLIIPSIIISGS